MNMKYAIIRHGSKQYKVKEGSEITIEKIEELPGEKLVFKDVLLLSDDNEGDIGRPNLPNLVVSAKILEHVKDKKIRVATYKAKSRLRRVKGHRQKLTRVLIEKISQPAGKKPSR